MTEARASAYAPATVANLGPGFDILGLALAEPGDTVTVGHSDAPGVNLKGITGDGGQLPREPEKNTAYVAALHVLRTVAPGQGIDLWLEKGLPLASGLGSSAASAVAAAVATNALFGNPLTTGELLPACIEAEAIVSGRHADNVAPALFGGIILVTGLTPRDLYPLPVPDSLHLAVVSPNVRVPTSEARAVLPSQVSLHTMVEQTAIVAKLVHALHCRDTALLAEAVSSDRVIEPARAHLMPFLRDAQQAAREAGALATIISGAGPTVCSICDSAKSAELVRNALSAFYEQKGIETISQATQPSRCGAAVLNG